MQLASNRIEGRNGSGASDYYQCSNGDVYVNRVKEARFHDVTSNEKEVSHGLLLESF